MITEQSQILTPAEVAQKTYAPSLTLYHANAKGTGSAVSFEVKPATGDRDGCWFMALAPQKSIAQGSKGEADRRNATFSWSEKLVVKLGFADLSAMLMVFTGRAQNLADGKGLFHDTADCTTIIGLAPSEGNFPGFSLEVSKKRKADGSASRVRILLNPVESFGLARLIEGTLPRVAFGV